VSASRIRVFLVAGALCLLLASQALASSVMPAERAAVGGVAGKAAFAYMGGLRTFAAAVLWNRIEPQFHDYYERQSLLEQKFVFPTLAIVQALDPQFTQSYFLSSYLIARQGDFDYGLEIAREGVLNNPDSGLLRSNLAQLLYLQDQERNMPEALEHVRIGLSGDIDWANDDEYFEGLAIFRSILETAGETEVAERIGVRMQELRESGIGLGDHDHDGDGIQDH
jgi:hypothetical protein